MMTSNGPPTPKGVGGPSPPLVSRGSEEGWEMEIPTLGPPSEGGGGGPGPPPTPEGGNAAAKWKRWGTTSGRIGEVKRRGTTLGRVGEEEQGIRDHSTLIDSVRPPLPVWTKTWSKESVRIARMVNRGNHHGNPI